MALENLTVLDGLLKDVYQDVVREQISTYSAVQEAFTKVTDYEWTGRQAIEAAIMSFNEGISAMGESGNLPTAGNFDPQNFKIPMKYVYGSFQMTKQMMESAITSKGAFRNATRYSMETLVRNIKRERARMLWGAGTGIKCLVNGAVSSSTTVNVDAPGNVAGSVGGTRYIRPGMIVGFWTTVPAHEVTGTVASVAADGNSFELSASATITTNDYVVAMTTASSTAAADSGLNNEPMGLLGLVDDGTYVTTLHNLSRTTYPQLKSRVQSSVGALSLDAIQLNFDIAEQMGDANISMLAGHHAVRRAYLALLEADRRYAGADLQSPDGGTKVTKRNQYVTFGGVPMIEDKYAPYDMLFGLDKSDMKRYVQIEGEWADDDGRILRQVSGKDEWTAFYRIWENYHCSRPNTCFRMDGITTTKVFVQSY